MSQPSRAPQPQHHPGFPNQQAEIDRINQLSRYITVSRDQNYHDWLDFRLKSGTCGVALSAPRCGLSESSQYYQQKRVKYSGSVIALPAPVFYIRIPPACNQRSFLITVLGAMHRNLQAGQPDDLRNRLKATLRQYGVKLLIFDDAQHLRQKAFQEVVQLFDTMKIPIVLCGNVGLDEKLFKKWRGWHNALEAEHRFPALTKKELSETVVRWLLDCLAWAGESAEESNLLYEDVLDRLLSLSQGYSGSLFDLLRQIAVATVIKDRAKIDDSTIEEVLGMRRRQA